MTSYTIVHTSRQQKRQLHRPAKSRSTIDEVVPWTSLRDGGTLIRVLSTYMLLWARHTDLNIYLNYIYIYIYRYYIYTVSLAISVFVMIAEPVPGCVVVKGGRSINRVRGHFLYPRVAAPNVHYRHCASGVDTALREVVGVAHPATCVNKCVTPRRNEIAHLSI